MTVVEISLDCILKELDYKYSIFFTHCRCYFIPGRGLAILLVITTAYYILSLIQTVLFLL